jgi:hypothetical protein
VIAAGVEADEDILLSKPDIENITLVTLDKSVRDQALNLLEQWKTEKRNYDDINLKKVAPEDGPGNTDFDGGGMIIIGG